MANFDKKDIFESIEEGIIKLLHENANKYLTYREIHSELLEDFDIKDPIIKEDFKKKIEIVLRSLSANSNPKFRQIYIKIDENGILSATFSKKEPDDLINFPYSENEKYIIRFIVDENITKYFSKKDFRGNNILHYLVLDHDFERINKIFKNIEDLFLEENKEGLTPLELIRDVRISSLYIKYLFIKNNQNKCEILFLENEFKNIEKNIEKHILDKKYKDSYILYSNTIIIFLLTINLFNYFTSNFKFM
jgi:hypothetical protein